MKFSFPAYGLGVREFAKKIGLFEVHCKHHYDDPPTVYRLHITSPCGLRLELTPSKALSLRDCSYENRQMFWDAPKTGLPDPMDVDICSSVIRNSEIKEYSGWVKYFASHVEMLGLYNWGMSYVNLEGVRYALHGNVSNIPIKELEIELTERMLLIKGSYKVYGAHSIFPKENEKVSFEIQKQVNIFVDEPRITQTDTITNYQEKPCVPDWGYHIQLYPENRCRYLIPGKTIAERFGKVVPTDYDTWISPIAGMEREEQGYTYKDVLVGSADSENISGVPTLLKYQNGLGIKVILPPSPYIMSWQSRDGGDGVCFLDEVQRANKKPKRIFEKGWNGIGPEIGASDLDHKGNVDSNITQQILQPKESMSLMLEFCFLNESSTKILENKILNYQLS